MQIVMSMVMRVDTILYTEGGPIVNYRAVYLRILGLIHSYKMYARPPLLSLIRT